MGETHCENSFYINGLGEKIEMRGGFETLNRGQVRVHLKHSEDNPAQMRASGRSAQNVCQDSTL